MSYTMTRTVERPFSETLQAIRSALQEQGFGILTEIDLQATLKSKINADIEPQVILGACRPPLAHAAVQAEPSVGVLLPCNVVVRSTEGRTVIEAMDPAVMVELTGDDALTEVASDARSRIEAALAQV